MNLALAIISLAPLIFLHTQTPDDPRTKLEAAIKSGEIAWQFSEPEEIVKLIGKPNREEKHTDGGQQILTYHYEGGLTVSYSRSRETRGWENSPFGLFAYKMGEFEVVRSGPLKLRNASDLIKIDSFWGLAGVDASMADLAKEEARLRRVKFDTLTRWPGAEKMPKGFNPAEILESGKNPGLGIRALHARGIDGRGVDIAIFDQPLIPDHVEIEGRIKIIAELGVEGVPPQMHGPATTSVAVGKTCGVAPKANLYYVSYAMWAGEKMGNQYNIQALEKVLELNKTKSANIRIVSISMGAWREYAQFDIWQTLLERAENEGVLVLTCDLEATKLDYGSIVTKLGGDRDKPEDYILGRHVMGNEELLVPTELFTFASHKGKKEYTFNQSGGMSSAVQWIAGLAVLGFQVNPDLKPADIRKYLKESATVMPYGKVANPEKFIEMCKGNQKDTSASK
ncbi:MAG: hypothetical protein FWG02_04740 [Holophagaceae bacterium]|nr:hypothetical protein [Holophagaceae bacterium]